MQSVRFSSQECCLQSNSQRLLRMADEIPKKAMENTKQNLHQTTFQHVPSCHLVLSGQVTPISPILPQEMSSALEGLIAFDKLNEQPIIYCNTCLKSPACS